MGAGAEGISQSISLKYEFGSSFFGVKIFSPIFIRRYKDLCRIKYIDKLYDLFNCKEQDINKNKIDNRESENIDKDEFISYKLALKTFIDIDSVLEQLNSIKNIGPGGLGEYQKIFLELKNNINLIKINNEYYAKIFNAKIVSEKEMNSFNSLLSSLEKSFYSIIETRKKLYEYMNGNTIVHLNLEDLNKNIENSIKYFSLSAKEILNMYIHSH